MGVVIVVVFVFVIERRRATTITMGRDVGGQQIHTPSASILYYYNKLTNLRYLFILCTIIYTGFCQPRTNIVKYKTARLPHEG